MEKEMQGQAGMAKMKIFSFKDCQDEVVNVNATDEKSAWLKLSHDFATPVSDMKKMVKLLPISCKP